jgi:hypothetical protein
MYPDRKKITRETTLETVSVPDDRLTAKVWHGPRDAFLQFEALTGRARWGHSNEDDGGPADQTEVSVSEYTTDSRDRGRTKLASLCLSREQAVALRDLLIRAYPL